MGLRFLPVPLEEIRVLGDRAAVLKAYLKLLSKYADNEGYIERSATQIENDLGYGRKIQQSARKELVKRGLLDIRIKNKRSPTMEYKIK